MEYEILKFIFDQPPYEEIKLNDFLKERYGDGMCQKIRDSLYGLTNSGKIVIRDEAQRSMCVLVRIPSTARENTQATLDNWDLYATIKEPGRQFVIEKLRQDKQDALLERQTVINEESGRSVIDTNDFSKKIAGKNMIILWLTLIVAAAGAFATIKSCQIANQQNKQSKLIEQQDQSILTLKNKLTEKDVTLSAQKKTIDSLLQTKNDAKQKVTNIVKLTKTH
jgi:hypothetical protein